MDSIDKIKDVIDSELKCITHSPVTVPGEVDTKDHKDDISYFIKMLEKGVPVCNDGPPILRTSESNYSLIIIRSLIIKYSYFDRCK